MTTKFSKLVVAASAFVSVAANAESPILTKTGLLPEPQAGKGLVVFYRPGIMGALMGCTVREGDAELARLGSKKYFALAVNPGIHEYSTHGELNDRVRLEVEEDETYFVRCNVSAGTWGGKANLEPSNRDEFIEKAPRLNVWIPRVN
ncbi:DUF2846 domain-containing protein [Sphingomonas sp. SM33]|uniref:DUF2846 domain-containing protein n=1 Tax=Sphingomonas telluris TaxID=2907998 RepID=A0ABS9VHT5_9SPHN|nr:DUF2846 domain-containing protein [Sphingomonas telluris]MCH8614510.1 DUF2846 domain-containing protein [Sphingomonas telluris]